MGLKNLRNLPVKLDPNDHGYGEAARDELGEVVIERDEPAPAPAPRAPRCPTRMFVDDGFPPGQCERRAGHPGLCDVYDGRDD